MDKEKPSEKKGTFLVIIEQDEDGYVVLCPSLHIHTQGDTFDEACMMLADALKLNEDIVFNAGD